MNVSIIICTRNRADSLEQTLKALSLVEVPAGFQIEIVVVDNGSTDHTAKVVKNRDWGISVRYVFEPSPGLSKARNAGLAAAGGEILLFTDDDVVPAKNWLERIATPLIQRECDAVVGRIDLAQELCRPWITPQNTASLAVFEGPGDGPLHLIGANMGFHRNVLERVPAFDFELGAGALGSAEEILFSWQLLEAGFRLRYIPEAGVVHYPEISRLLRANCLSAGRKYGASLAYIIHHWEHKKLRIPRLRFYYLGLKLAVRRIIQPQPAMDAEGIAAWEISYAAEMEKCRRYLAERKRPRKYSKRGLQRLGQSP
jgi:glucosyl-dolichyl phosphate glucuronosyltransferase